MRLALIGLGKMGYNMTLRLIEGGHEVVAVDRNLDVARELATKGSIFAQSNAEAIGKLQGPRVVWVMVPAEVTEAVIQEVAGHLSKGDVIIDGGNSNWKDSRARAERLAEKGILFCDAGTSGGVWGLKNGYCLMVGGAPEAIKICEPIFKALAPVDGYANVGPAGAGHYVKMVHNGIEYGLMQAYAEGWELLEATPLVTDVRKVFESWQKGTVIRSWLLDLAVRALDADEHLSQLRGYAEDSGEGRWTVQAAIDHAVPLPVITASLFARFSSRQDDSPAMKMVAALRNQFGGHAVTSSAGSEEKGADAPGADTSHGSEADAYPSA
jgi:6-phosphogluconate dehydrogenase